MLCQINQLVQRIAEVEAANDALEQRLLMTSPAGTAAVRESTESAEPMAASAEAHLKRVRISNQPAPICPC